MLKKTYLTILIVLMIGIVTVIISAHPMRIPLFGRLIYGKNVVNFYRAINTPSTPENFDKILKFCREMDDSPKKDACFYLTAQRFARTDIQNAKKLCNEIQGIGDQIKKDECFKEVEKISNQ